MMRGMDNSATYSDLLTYANVLRQQVEQVVAATPVIDVHTHICPPEFGGICLFGIDDLLNYHYLIAETFRSTKISYAGFGKMRKTERADLIWKTLFVENTPLSEAARGIVSVLDAFGLDARAPSLKEARAFFKSRNLPDHLDRVLEIAGVSDIVMTNDPFHKAEANAWKNGGYHHARFHSSLRMDTLLDELPDAARALAHIGLP